MTIIVGLNELFDCGCDNCDNIDCDNNCGFEPYDDYNGLVFAKGILQQFCACGKK